MPYELQTLQAIKTWLYTQKHLPFHPLTTDKFIMKPRLFLSFPMSLLLIFQTSICLTGLVNLNSTDPSTTLKAAHMSSFTKTTDLLNSEEAKNCSIFLTLQVSKFYLCEKASNAAFHLQHPNLILSEVGLKGCGTTYNTTVPKKMQ